MFLGETAEASARGVQRVNVVTASEVSTVGVRPYTPRQRGNSTLVCRGGRRFCWAPYAAVRQFIHASRTWRGILREATTLLAKDACAPNVIYIQLCAATTQRATVTTSASLMRNSWRHYVPHGQNATRALDTSLGGLMQQVSGASTTVL